MKIYDYNGKKNICGDRLREARVVRRLRQEDLAAQIQLKGINMERDSISRIEIGTRFVSDFELKIDRKEVKTLSKKKQKKSGNKKDQPASTINLITAIVNLVIAILLLIEKLTR